jgi:hypothetical protein
VDLADAMVEISFDKESDFESDRHRLYREESWLGGPAFEICYFLSCLQRVNYFQTPQTDWEPAAQQFVNRNEPESAWICQSSYFVHFAALLLKHRYRESELGKCHPIRKERREERVERFAIANAKLPLSELATLLQTTVKQIERNSDAMLARREYARLNPEQ